VVLESASYLGSLPFGGVFQVFDLASCIQEGADGRHFITVRCHFGESAYDEDMELQFELKTHPLAIHGIVGGAEAVVHIAWDSMTASR